MRAVVFNKVSILSVLMCAERRAEGRREGGREAADEEDSALLKCTGNLKSFCGRVRGLLMVMK